MDRNAIKSNLGVIAAVGSIWGLTEFLFGLGLQKCATLYTGAILTGLAFFWLSFIWSVMRSIIPVLIIVGIVMLFKMLDAVFLPVALNHGSILNPMYAFFTILVGFVILISVFRNRFSGKLMNRILVGAGAAMIATAMFPLVKFATGNPACVYAATNIPLAIYTAPVAILLSMITVPLGFKTATWYNSNIQGLHSDQPVTRLARLWSPAVVVCCLLIITLVRII
ncbi:MAG: hypothetical protein KAT15_13830 [Bacteroidales bacterium]|nr:hypothetical protein [Bacteroidales bacterium]